MPLLDVSEVLSDPLFADTLVCTHQTQTMVNGFAVNSPTVTTFSGVVTSDSGRDLMRQAEGQMVKGSILIHTTFRLTDGSQGVIADEVLWNGVTYTISQIDDYSRYGAGFICATAELKPLAGS